MGDGVPSVLVTAGVLLKPMCSVKRSALELGLDTVLDPQLSMPVLFLFCFLFSLFSLGGRDVQSCILVLPLFDYNNSIP